MIITINTDASFSNTHKIGCFAFWITSNVGRVHKSGKLMKSCQDASEAEMKCICNALFFLSGDPDLNKEGNCIIVNTDSMNAIHVFTKNKKAINKWGLKKKNYQICEQRFFEIKKSLKTKQDINLRHVKAHSGIKDKRSWVNEWCDAAAKNEMEKLIGPRVVT